MPLPYRSCCHETTHLKSKVDDRNQSACSKKKVERFRVEWSFSGCFLRS